MTLLYKIVAAEAVANVTVVVDAAIAVAVSTAAIFVVVVAAFVQCVMQQSSIEM